MYLKISKLLETISFKLRQKALYFELKHHILSDKTYIRPVYSHERGIGKTHTLIELSHKLDIPIAAPNRKYMDYVMKLSKDKYGQPVEIFVADYIKGRGKRYHTVLCEEGISLDNMNFLLRGGICKQLVGYRSGGC
jgi:hypothetical protein